MNITEERVQELETAIRNHRDQKSDDRCWLDDLELYLVLKEPINADNSMPPKEDFLKNCERYYQNRCQQGNWKTYQQLEEECDFFRRRLNGIHYNTISMNILLTIGAVISPIFYYLGVNLLVFFILILIPFFFFPLILIILVSTLDSRI